MHVCVCVCVCVREREREHSCVCLCMYMCAFVFQRRLNPWEKAISYSGQKSSCNLISMNAMSPHENRKGLVLLKESNSTWVLNFTFCLMFL